MKLKWIAPISFGIWLDEVIIYHQSSGDTFLFADDAKDLVLECVSKLNFSKEELLNICEERIKDSFQRQAFVETFLQRLVKKDLITTEAE